MTDFKEIDDAEIRFFAELSFGPNTGNLILVRVELRLKYLMFLNTFNVSFKKEAQVS